jgi:hypothetical protein
MRDEAWVSWVSCRYTVHIIRHQLICHQLMPVWGVWKDLSPLTALVVGNIFLFILSLLVVLEPLFEKISIPLGGW